MKTLASFLLLISFLFSCTHKAPVSRSVTNQDIAQDAFERNPYAALEFPKGKSGLSEMNKKYLNEFARKAARSGKEIQEIKVLAWSDKEYPGQSKVKASVKDILLANARANTIREYIRGDLNTRTQIDVFNMAKKPDLLSSLTKSEDYRVKENVEVSGVSATRLPSGQTSYTKAGKVLVIIDYKDEIKTK